MDRLTKYIRATASEMRQVKWPTQNQAIIYTALVVAICAVTAVFLAAFDFFFAQVIDYIVSNF